MIFFVVAFLLSQPTTLSSSVVAFERPSLCFSAMSGNATTTAPSIPTTAPPLNTAGSSVYFNATLLLLRAAANVLPGPALSGTRAPDPTVQPGTIMAVLTAIALAIVAVVILMLYKRDFAELAARRKRRAELAKINGQMVYDSPSASPDASPPSSPRMAPDTQPTFATAMDRSIVQRDADKEFHELETARTGVPPTVSALSPQTAAAASYITRTGDYRGPDTSKTATPLTSGGYLKPPKGLVLTDVPGPGHLPPSVYHQWAGFSSTTSPTTAPPLPHQQQYYYRNGVATTTASPPPAMLGSAFYDPMYDDEL